MKLINKDVLIAEIKRLRDTSFELYGCSQFDSAYNNVLKFIDTLEVKEMDLDAISRHYLLHEHISSLNVILHQADLKVEMQYHKDIENAYKAGFNFALKTQKGE